MTKKRPNTSAADLKFLHHLPRLRARNFRSKSGTRIIKLLVPFIFSKFVSEVAALYHELRKEGTRLPQTLIPAIALALSIACAGPALSQSASPGSASSGTAGAGNAAAANDSLGGGGGGPPTMSGTGPGTTSPGGINSAPQAGAPPPSSARPNQVPDTAGATNTSTTPSSGTVGMSTGRIPGHTGRISTVQESSDPVVEETEKEVSKRIKSICRGC